MSTNNDQKILDIKNKIENLVKSNQATLSLDIYYLLKIDQAPRDSILEYIRQPDIKLMRAEKILQSICPHQETKNKSKDHAVCSHCLSPLDGWWCDKSPDNKCYYFSDAKGNERVVILDDGVEVVLPVGHDDEYETEDSCLFCGQPEERK